MGILTIDLWRFYRNPHAIQIREAIWTSIGWISLALLFNVWIYFTFGFEHALTFLTGYIVEESLSVDNLFIFLLIFSHFRVPEKSKHQVLFYGVLGAIIMRALLIWAGITLVSYFSGIFIFFGLFLIFVGVRLALKQDNEEQLEHSRVYRLIQKFIPMTHEYKEQSFFVKQNGKWIATPLFAVLILIEFTDLVFALDSVPAILGITTEPFIVYTSNIFAVLGLRSLFFALEGLMKKFYLIHYALAFILVFIGVKMVLIEWVHVSTWITLTILLLSLTLAIVGSIYFPAKDLDNNKN
jgi:tellurite resistance protein TerC